MSQKYLSIYLTDHLGGATAGVELAKRAANNNRDNPEFGSQLTRLATEIEEDRQTLKRIMARLEIGEDHIKTTLGWALEKIGRLKPNGELLQFSPLSRLVEVEGLISGVSAKLSLWRVLIAVQSAYPQIDEAELNGLADRAEEQLTQLHELRDAAGRIAFMP
jgi:hypothetical protein